LRLLLAALVALSGAGPPIPGAAVDPSLDDAVLAAALDDLVTYKGKDTPVYGPFSHAKPLAFAVAPARFPLTVDGVLYRYREELWKTLTPAEVAASREAAQSVVERVKTLPPDATFTISDKRVRLRDPRTEEKPESFRFDRTTKAWQPGYSKDGRLAIVRFDIPWSIHSADATYVLVRQDGGWKVRVRQFVIYP
jgi:hypothetical protein